MWFEIVDYPAHNGLCGAVRCAGWTRSAAVEHTSLRPSLTFKLPAFGFLDERERDTDSVDRRQRVSLVSASVWRIEVFSKARIGCLLSHAAVVGPGLCTIASVIHQASFQHYIHTPVRVLLSPVCVCATCAGGEYMCLSYVAGGWPSA